MGDAHMDQSSLVGQRIRQRREELGITLTALADRADVAKSYLSSLENGQGNERPSGRTLYRIAEALGTTMSDLLGSRLLVEPPYEVPAALREFAESAGISDRDVAMLAGINFRGQQPADRDGWAFVWRAIRASVEDDKNSR
jgi:DNA-binding XRE family transcriptional regulator